MLENKTEPNAKPATGIDKWMNERREEAPDGRATVETKTPDEELFGANIKKEWSKGPQQSSTEPPAKTE